jgi:hypothetical protein
MQKRMLAIIGLVCLPLAAQAQQTTLCTSIVTDNPSNPFLDGIVAVSETFPVEGSGDYDTAWKAHIDQKYPGKLQRTSQCSAPAADPATAAQGRLNFINKWEAGFQTDLEPWRPAMRDVASGDSAAPDPAVAGTQEATSDDAADAGTQAEAQDGSDADDNAVAQEQARRAEAQAQAQREQQARDAQREQELAAQRQREADAAAAEQREKARIAAEKASQAASTDTDANRCISSAETRANDTFEGNTSASVVNGCGEPVDVRICLMTDTSRGWNCGVVYGVAPQAKGSFSSFHASGQVFVDARLSSSKKPLAQP